MEHYHPLTLSRLQTVSFGEPSSWKAKLALILFCFTLPLLCHMVTNGLCHMITNGYIAHQWCWSTLFKLDSNLGTHRAYLALSISLCLDFWAVTHSRLGTGLWPWWYEVTIINPWRSLWHVVTFTYARSQAWGALPPSPSLVHLDCQLGTT